MTRFGPSGNDVTFYAQGNKSSVQAPAWLASMGLTALEINFGRGVKLSEKTAAEIGSQAKKHNITLSVHAPYYINLASSDEQMIRKSYVYIEMCIRVMKFLGSNRLVIHIGSQCDLQRGEAIENCKKNLMWVISELKRNDFKDFFLFIETMGRYKAIGDYKEVCEICKIDPCVIPTLDFGHINCTEQGELKRNPERIREIMEYCIKELGDKMRNVHIHFSYVKFGQKGELAHTTLDDKKWAFPFEPLAQVIQEEKLEPIIICESQDIMAQDAKRLQAIWQNVAAN